MPQVGGGDALLPAIEGTRQHRLVPIVDPMDEDFAVLLKLPHGIADVGDAILVGQHRAAVDLGLDPRSGGPRLARRQVGRAPLATKARIGR